MDATSEVITYIECMECGERFDSVKESADHVHMASTGYAFRPGDQITVGAYYKLQQCTVLVSWLFPDGEEGWYYALTVRGNVTGDVMNVFSDTDKVRKAVCFTRYEKGQS